MHSHFTLNEDHLKLYRKTILFEIAKELNIHLSGEGMKVKDLITLILMQPNAKEYLPGIMQFFDLAAEVPEGQCKQNEELAEAA